MEFCDEVRLLGHGYGVTRFWQQRCCYVSVDTKKCAYHLNNEELRLALAACFQHPGNILRDLTEQSCNANQRVLESHWSCKALLFLAMYFSWSNLKSSLCRRYMCFVSTTSVGGKDNRVECLCSDCRFPKMSLANVESQAEHGELY